jgi:hypothetical protein
VKRLLILALAPVLAACGTLGQVRTETVVETRYVIRQASAAQKQLPPNPAPIDVSKATQLDLAEWIAQSERRMLDLEDLIRRLIEFYERPLKDDEK